MDITRVGIVGNGNVGWFFSQHFVAFKGLTVWQVSKSDGAPVGVHQVQKVVDLPSNLDLYLLCVPDDAIASVAKELTHAQGIVAHVSGFADIQLLADCAQPAVCYPYQTLTKGRFLPASEVPIMLEACSDSVRIALEKLTSKLGFENHYVPTLARKKMHLAAVFANNFVNHLLLKATSLAGQSDVNAEVLQPLFRETLQKALVLGPEKAQTGPARRGDLKTISGHLELLSPEAQELYQILTNSITSTYEDKL
jgi:predicted short-subunit dehydrogenase-like oxidoreductase (DUF2520 family)